MVGGGGGGEERAVEWGARQEENEACDSCDQEQTLGLGRMTRERTRQTQEEGGESRGGGGGKMRGEGVCGQEWGWEEEAAAVGGMGLGAGPRGSEQRVYETIVIKSRCDVPSLQKHDTLQRVMPRSAPYPKLLMQQQDPAACNSQSNHC